MPTILLTPIQDLINFTFNRLMPKPQLIKDMDLTRKAFHETCLDFQYHWPEMTPEDVKTNILRNCSGLPIFLYRLVKSMDVKHLNEDFKYQVHFFMRTICACEVYWSSEIGEGLRIDHGMGMVIGSRAKIGKGFWIHHGCTVGHRDLYVNKDGPVIGNDVILCSNSQILGNITVGDKTVVAANSLLIHSTDGHCVMAGTPARKIKSL